MISLVFSGLCLSTHIKLSPDWLDDFVSMTLLLPGGGVTVLLVEGESSILDSVLDLVGSGGKGFVFVFAGSVFWKKI